MANTYVVIAASVLFCIGFIGNSITVGFIAVSKKLHTPTYVTIGCLAVSDVLVSMTQYVSFLPDPVESFLNEYPKKDIYAVFTFFSIHSAFFHMVIVSYVRFVMITDPLQSLQLTCRKIMLKSSAVWISSVVISVVYGQARWFTIEIMSWIKIGFVLYVSGVPFIVVMYLNLRKLYYLYNQTPSVRRLRVANSMSLMFCIIIALYLLSTLYPLFYAVDGAVLRNRSLLNRKVYVVHKMFNFSLFANSCLNPLIYFMFSPPVLRLLSRLRKRCHHSTDARANNPRLSAIGISS